MPLYVQTLRQDTVAQIRPFLKTSQDIVVSLEQTRLRILALAAVCPGASTMIGGAGGVGGTSMARGRGVSPRPPMA